MPNFIRKFNRAVWRNIFYILRAIISHIPRFIFLIIYQFLHLLSLVFMFTKRRVAMEGLRNAFGDTKTEKEIRSIASKCFTNIGRGMIELIYLIDRPKEILRRVSIEGKAHLDKALAEGRGAVVISAHFGIFILMYLRLVLEGYKVNVIMRKMRDPLFEEYIHDYCSGKGVQIIFSQPERQCIQNSLKVLRKGEILIVLMDQSFGQFGGVFVDFLGKKAATAPGAVIFARRAECPIVPVFIMNDTKDKYKIVIEPPIEQARTEASLEDMGLNISRASQVIEKFVRAYPYEWGGWMHRRWKKKYEPERDYYYSK